MDQLNHDRRDAEESKSDQHGSSSSAFEPSGPARKPDPCDFLLDAIDAQLGKLQVKQCQQQERDRIDSDSTSRPVAPVPREAATREPDEWTSSKVELESHKEQVMWRLERLLGDTSKQGTMSGDPHPPSESICTEDFMRCFREEMVELALPEGSMQELDRDEEAETASMSDGDQSDQNSQKGVRCEAIPNMTSSKEAASLGFFQYKPEQRQELERCPSETSGDQTSHDVVYSAEVKKEHRNPKHISSPKARCLAVSVDSDLDSVCTDQVRRHLRRRRRPVERPTAVQNKRTCRKAQHGKRDTCRAKSLGADDKDTDEDSNGRWSGRSKLERASETMHSTWERMSERLCSLRRRCGKEEETLRMTKSHLTEVELSLSELQLRRKHAFQDLDRLSAETVHLETEKRQLEVLLKERKAERDSLSCQLQQLKRQKESHLCEVRRLEEELKKKEQLKQLARVEKTDTAMAQLARQAMERQLACAKAELFSEQRRAREKQESMQQMLEETCEELLRVSLAATALRNRCSCLEEPQKQNKEETEVLMCQACELQGKLVDTLEKTLRQKEQRLQELQEQHRSALREARERAHAMMGAALKQQRKDLVSVHDQQIQKLKKDEAKALKKSLEHQKEELRKREEELHAGTLAKVRKGVDGERRKWEAEKMEAVHFHCALLEEQNRRSLETARSDTQREKSNALTLQHQVTALQSEREKTALQLEQAVQRANGETEKIRRRLEEQQISHNEARAEQDQQLGVWAQELVAECEFLHLLMQQNGGQQNSVQLSPSPTIDEALIHLKAQRGPLKHLIGRLHQESVSQRQASEQLHKDKERELRIQRQQMRTEQNQALDCLKERLIQEHIEELSSLKWCRTSGGGLEASLRKQLEAKDMELRQVQRNMTQWKERTAARLACEFEEELTSELERCRTKLIRGRKTSTNEEAALRSEGQRKLSAKHRDCLTYVYAAAPRSPSDVASLKLVHYLQSRVKRLRVENQKWMATGPTLPTLSYQESEKA
ncbi:trichohyalin [Phyllopteryx taeniolatus]|uniref:trichohyalin n=1 Tax=Phyllopteryx taeniolatus TaxID=161469 RepID=UPI002AD3F878|nr:trichohyalin [Phyllopteryx taeniolatus]